MPITGDLINIPHITSTDTFATWMDRTNEVIDALNPEQVYEVNVGATGGLLKQTGLSAGNYNGVVTVSVNPGPGIGTRTFNGSSLTVVDFSLYDDYGLTLGSNITGSSQAVANFDEIIVNDVSDTSAGPEGTPKKVKATNMLPPNIDINTITFNGNVIVGGNLTTLGGTDFIASNNLRIEDKLLEIAYQQAIPLTLTGVTGGTFLPTSFGATAYYFQGPTSGLTATFYAHLQSFTGGAAGPTGIFNVGSLFQDPYGVEDITSTASLTGYMSLSATGNPRYRITSIGTAYSSFLSDTLLSEAGFVVRGASSDKEFAWIYIDPDSGTLYNAFVTNTNLGLSGPNDAIITRNFRSYGYQRTDSEYIFKAENTKNDSIYLAELNSAGTDTQGSWKISKKPLSSNSDLVFSYCATGTTESNTLFTWTKGASGTTYPGITTTSFGAGFNADQLDGAHAATGSTPWTIPVAGAYGTIDENWMEASSIRKRFTIVSHGLTNGNIVRLTATGNVVLAKADTVDNAEALGVVAGVTGNSFTVVLKGYISGMSGPRDTTEGTEYTPGEVYFLSGTNAGKLLANPDTGSYKLSIGQVRKAMFLANSTTTGFVLDYLGAAIPTPTDEVYLSGLVPIGTILPYSGDPSNLTSEWLICDGKRYDKTTYRDLYNIIGKTTYYAKATLSGTTITPDGGSLGILVGDVLDVYTSAGAYIASPAVTAVSSVGTLTTNYGGSVTGAVQLFLKTDSLGNDIFLLPDLRTRSVIGGSTGGSAFGANNFAVNYELGDQGGSAYTTLSVSQLPSHSHGVSSTTTSSGTNTGVVSSVLGTLDITTGATGSGSQIDIRDPYVSLYYVIRAKMNTAATILTGHDHDLRYIRYDATHSGLVLANRDQFRTNAHVAGTALGSATTGDTHDHDQRYTRFDTNAQGLSVAQKAYARTNTSSAALAENDGYDGTGLTHNHDRMYVRFDSVAQASFNSTSQNFFRTKIGVYGTADSDSRFLNTDGDTATGTINFNGFLVTNNTVYHNDPAFIISNGSGGLRLVETYLDTGAANNANSNDSQSNLIVKGDFTVLGDGLAGGVRTSGSAKHTQSTFFVDPRISRATVCGGFAATDNSNNAITALPPELRLTNDLVNGSVTTPVGIVSGLTAPTRDDQAANKWYVDNNRKYSNTIIVGPNGALGNQLSTVGSPTYNISLESGTWLVDVMIYAYPGNDRRDGVSMFLDYNISGDANPNQYHFDISDDDNLVTASSKMIVTKHVVTSTGAGNVLSLATDIANPNIAHFHIITYLQVTAVKIGN